MTVCTLVDGPFAGSERDIPDQRNLVTLEVCRTVSEWRAEGDSPTVEVERVELASYRRISADRFEHCPTPCRMGDVAAVVAGKLRFSEVRP